MEHLRVTVAVLTYKRPTELSLGLPLILQQMRALTADPTKGVTVRLLIIDNDSDSSAEAVARSFGSNDLDYVVEPEPGISAARNRAIDEARHSDLLVYLDDDERPRERWLDPLVQTWRTSKAAAVMGRVISEFEGELDPWVAAGDFFRRPSMVTGTEIRVVAAGNLLLDLHQLRSLGVRFEHSLGLSGGEDTLLSRHLEQRGARMVWCDESSATDYVPPSRMKRQWVLTRAWSHGNTASLVELYVADGPRARLVTRIQATGRGLARVAGGTGRFLFGILTRSYRHQARGLRAAYRGAGMISGAFGLVYQEYAREST